MKLIDLTGKRFGRLTVLRRGPDKSSKYRNNPRWYTVCDCGTERLVGGSNLRKGQTVSCGCYLRERIRETCTKGPGESAKNIVLRVYKAKAAERGLSWKITEQTFLELSQKRCFYCGAEPANEIKTPGGSFKYNGLDRVDNLRGYEAGNILPCCWDCNHAKSDMRQKDFIAWIKRIASRF